jgi:hypothetical protein
MTDYQVVGECAHVVVTDHTGVSATNLLYKGAPIPDDIDPDRLEHLLASGLVAEVGEVPLAPNAAVEQDGQVGIPPSAPAGTPQAEATPDVDPEIEAEREAARAKLPADGSAPHANAGKPVWVEHAVRSGMDRAEAEKVDKADLIAALK